MTELLNHKQNKRALLYRNNLLNYFSLIWHNTQMNHASLAYKLQNHLAR